MRFGGRKALSEEQEGSFNLERPLSLQTLGKEASSKNPLSL